MLDGLSDTKVRNRADFEGMLNDAVKASGLKLSAPVRKAVLAALSERDETATICRKQDGTPEPDPYLRDTERVPLGEDVNTFFDREVAPHFPDAWIGESKRSAKEGEIGAVGYEINFNRYFYRYAPPRALEEIETDIREIEEEIVRMLGEATIPSSPP